MMGCIHIITGDGKGKTTAAVGMAIRAIGHGKKVLMVQFLKGRWQGEAEVSEKIRNFTIKQFGKDRFVERNIPKDIDFEYARKGFKFVKKTIKKYDMIILDEINVAIKMGIIGEAEVKELLISKPKKLELVLTGRYAKRSLKKLADYVSVIKNKKHPYKPGMKGRKGVEF